MAENYGGLNLYRRDICLEKEEIDKWMEFQKNSIGNLLFAKSAKGYGVIKAGDSDNSFKVSATIGATSFSIVGVSNSNNPVLDGSYAIDKNGKIIYLKSDYIHSITPYVSDEYYVKISSRIDYVERTSISVDINGNISGSNFQETLRGYSSGYPTYIKFYTKNEDGSFSIVDGAGENNSVYEVAEVSSDASAILSGSFVAASNLYYAVLGAYALGSAINQTESSGLYSYNACSVELEAVSGSVTNNGTDFYLAKISIDFSGEISAIEDWRDEGFYYQFDTENLGDSERALLDASNLSSANIISWLSILDTYSKSQSQGLFAYLNGGSNITNVDNWISQLGLYNENKTGRFITSMANAGLSDSSFSSSSWTDNGALINSTFGRSSRIDQFLVAVTGNINNFPNLVSSLVSSNLGTTFGMSGAGRLICETSVDTSSSALFRFIPGDSHREFRCIIDAGAGAENGKWYEVVMVDSNDTGWLNLVAEAGTTLNRGKVIQQGKMITLTGAITLTTITAGTIVFSIPSSIGMATVDIDFIAGSTESGDEEAMTLYIDANTRTVRLRDDGDIPFTYSFCVTYPAV